MTPSAAVAVFILLGAAAGAATLTRARSRSRVDYYLAGQRVGVMTNACAICGDYFSAASFLGVAAAVYASGVDGMWYAAGFAAGFVPVVLFLAAPLRRFGEFSIPDFLGRRLDSDTVRLATVGVVQLVILSYLIPQAVASGITWDLLVGAGVAGLSPYATGVLVSTAAIAGLVMFGGMRAATWTQASQFLLLLALLAMLAAAAVGGGFDYAGAVERIDAEPLRSAVVDADGEWTTRVEPHRIDAGRPARFGEPGGRYGPVGQFALIITLVLGTGGLPHVMNRFFTSPSGRAARTTTLWVLALAGVFYALAVMLGTAARALIPERVDDHPWLADLTVDGVLQMPEHALLVLGRLFAGQTGLGLVSSGALLAVMSTIAGLLLAGAASWGHDVFARHLRPGATERQAVRAGRVAVLVVAAVSAASALAVEPAALSALYPSIVATMVTWAFALAGSSITPVLLLAVWWPRSTAAGTVAGLVTGATTALALLVAGVAIDAETGDATALLLTPSLIAAPLAALVAVAVSRRTRAPQGVAAAWTRMHGTAADRAAERLAALTRRVDREAESR